MNKPLNRAALNAFIALAYGASQAMVDHDIRYTSALMQAEAEGRAMWRDDPREGRWAPAGHGPDRDEAIDGVAL